MLLLNSSGIPYLERSLSYGSRLSDLLFSRLESSLTQYFIFCDWHLLILHWYSSCLSWGLSPLYHERPRVALDLSIYIYLLCLLLNLTCLIFRWLLIYFYFLRLRHFNILRWGRLKLLFFFLRLLRFSDVWIDGIRNWLNQLLFFTWGGRGFFLTWWWFWFFSLLFYLLNFRNCLKWRFWRWGANFELFRKRGLYYFFLFWND